MAASIHVKLVFVLDTRPIGKPSPGWMECVNDPDGERSIVDVVFAALGSGFLDFTWVAGCPPAPPGPALMAMASSRISDVTSSCPMLVFLEYTSYGKTSSNLLWTGAGLTLCCEARARPYAPERMSEQMSERVSIHMPGHMSKYAVFCQSGCQNRCPTVPHIETQW